MRLGRAIALAKRVGLKGVVKSGLVRGGTDHCVNLLMDGGTVINVWRDGSTSVSSIGWLDRPYPRTLAEYRYRSAERWWMADVEVGGGA